jgi:hypothetical protein
LNLLRVNDSNRPSDYINTANNDNITFQTQIIVNDMSFQLQYRRIRGLIAVKAYIMAAKNSRSMLSQIGFHNLHTEQTLVMSVKAL